MRTKFIFCLIFLYLNDVKCELQDSSGICTDFCKCTNAQSTFQLDCSNNKITKVLSNWPDTKNASILKATFSGNEIPELDSLPGTDLELHLRYDHCNITELSDGLFESCSKVIFVDFSYNLLTGDKLYSKIFKGPYNETEYEPINLEYLNLAYNQIHSLTPKLFEHTPRLRHLNLEGNHFRVLDIATSSAFSTLVNIEYLNLGNNNLMHIPDNVLKPLRSLNTLDLSRNQLDFIPSDIFEVDATLRTLIIDGNPILDFTDDTFTDMEFLVEISARKLKSLIHINTNAFNPLINLRKIDLSEMNSTSIQKGAFGNISNLKELNISYSGLSNIPSDLVNWTNLEVFDMRGNYFNCECYLLDILKDLPGEIKREEDGPYCYDYKKFKQFNIYNLQSNVCDEEDWATYPSKGITQMHYLRITLVVVSLLLLILVGIGTWIGYARCNAQRQFRTYPFASSVIYNPISNNQH